MTQRFFTASLFFTTLILTPLMNAATAQEPDLRKCLILAARLQEEKLNQEMTKATAQQAIRLNQLNNVLLGTWQETLTPAQQLIKDNSDDAVRKSSEKITRLEHLQTKHNCRDMSFEKSVSDELEDR